MDSKNKETIKKVVIISIVILLLEYFLISTVGTFYRIILSFYAIKYLKEENYLAIKTILIMLFLPLVWGGIFILSVYI